MMPIPVTLDLTEYSTITELWRARLVSHTHDSYRGRVLQKFPEDLRVYQTLIESSAPEVIVELGSHDGGSALWFADQLQTFSGGGEVITVDVWDVRPFDREDITILHGDVTSQAIADKVAALVDGRRCMVVEDSAHTFTVTYAALDLYSHLVQRGQWFIVEDGVVDEQHLRLPGWPEGVQEAVTHFCTTERGRRFARHWLAPYGLTCHHGGWLQAT